MIIHCKFDALVDPKSLKYHPKNRNKHPKEQIERLAKILEYQGWRYAIKISNLSGFVTSGHGRIAAAIKNNWHEVPVVYQDYTDANQEYADVQADNAIASWSELDLSAINFDVPDLGPNFDIDMLGLKNFELEPADKYADKDADETPEIRKTDIKLGDLFQLGNHRLLCGDATDKASVERLMNGEKADMVYTDPPYGMNLDTDYSNLKGAKGCKPHSSLSHGRKFKPIVGDDKDYDPAFILSEFDKVKEIFLWGADFYHDKIPNSGSWIVWDKRTTADGRTPLDDAIGSVFELCWSKKRHRREIARIMHCGYFSVENDKRQHPSQKPVALHEWFFERWAKDKINIVDLYGGSGSTLIACEKTNKRCFMSEIDPQYCQVIIDRWEKFTGQKAKKIG